MQVKALAIGETAAAVPDTQPDRSFARQPADSKPDLPTRNQARYLELSDGRRLAYSIYGRNDGFPVFYFHSVGSSRLECRLFADSARRYGYRLIAIDRPGIGGSGYKAGFSHADVADDTVALADALGLEQAGLMSYASGAVFALSCAHRSPDRFRFLLSLGGLSGNLGWHNGRRRSYPARLAYAVLPGLVRFSTRMRHRLTGLNPEHCLDRLQDILNYTDRKILADPEVHDTLRAALAESTRQGFHAVAQDSALSFMEPAFGLHEIQVPVTFWQGSADNLCSRSYNDYLAARIPRAHSHSLANRGHFFFVQCMDEIFARTMSSARVVRESGVTAAVKACP